MESESGSFAIGGPDREPRPRPRKATKDRARKGDELYEAGAVGVVTEVFEDEVFDGKVRGSHVLSGRYSVRRSKGNGYTVVVRDARGREAECDCEDARRLRGRDGPKSCKHVHAAWAHIRVTNRRVRLERDIREYEYIVTHPEHRGGLKLSFFEGRLEKMRRELAALGGATEAASREGAERREPPPEEIGKQEQAALF